MANIIILISFFSLLIFVMIPVSLYAEGELSIKPGKYRLSKTTKTNFDTVPVTTTAEECITDPDLDPVSILPNRENCKIQNMKAEQNKTSFDFICKEPGSTSALKGHAEYSTEGDIITSNISLEGIYKGEELIVKSRGRGERIGDCTPEQAFSE